MWMQGQRAVTASPGRVYHLALRDRHVELGARMGVVGAWSLPLEYGDQVAEYRAIREGAAISDRSHRSRFLLSGTDAGEVLRACFGEPVRDLEEGRAVRAVSLGADGRIRDLAVVARTGGISYLVVGEPGQRFETRQRLQGAVQADYDVRIDDRTETTCLLGIAGPGAMRLAQEHLAEGIASRMPVMHTAMFELHGFRTLAVRTSDLGEDGMEVMLAPAVMLHLLDSLRTAGATLAGFLAQEVCRVEACIPAFLPDLETGLTPAEADIDILLGIEGGRQRQVLAGLLIEGGTVATGSSVASSESRAGEVRSCVHSPALDATIALAVLDQRHASPGTRLVASGQGATVVAKPFLRRRQTTP